jgi:hypothetical protein
MDEKFYKSVLVLVAVGFTVVFAIVVVPPLIQNPDIIGAFAAGFVNPYAAGYSSDVLFCWAALAAFVTYEARVLKVKYGWVCLLLGIVPGVAVGMALYFLVRHPQITQSNNKH